MKYGSDSWWWITGFEVATEMPVRLRLVFGNNAQIVGQAAAELLGLPLHPFSQLKFVTCLDRGS